MQVFRGFWEEELPDGRRVMHRPGDPVTLTDPAELARLTTLGVVGSEVRRVVPEPVAPVEEPAAPPAPEREKPWKTAKLEVWQEYARGVGVDPAGKSKAEIIAAVG